MNNPDLTTWEQPMFQAVQKMNQGASEFARRIAALWMVCDCRNRDKLESVFLDTFLYYRAEAQKSPAVETVVS